MTEHRDKDAETVQEPKSDRADSPLCPACKVPMRDMTAFYGCQSCGDYWTPIPLTGKWKRVQFQSAAQSQGTAQVSDIKESAAYRQAAEAHTKTREFFAGLAGQSAQSLDTSVPVAGLAPQGESLPNKGVK